MSHAFAMKDAAVASPGRWTWIGALALAAPAALLATRGGRERTETLEQIVVCAEAPAPSVAPPTIADETVPGNARYVSVDLDADGVDELVAETASGRNAIVFRQHEGEPVRVGSIPLIDADHPCKAELQVEDNRLIALDYAPIALGDSACEQTTKRHFDLVDGRLRTITTWTSITVVDK